MKLGFHYHVPATYRDGKIVTSSFLGVFLDAMAAKVERLVCFMHSPLESEESAMDYPLQSRNVDLVSLGPHVSVPKRLIRSRSIVNSVLSELEDLDIMLVRAPTPLVSAFVRIRSLKKAYLIVGDYSKSAKDLEQPYVRKLAIQVWAWLNKRQQMKAIKGSLVFVNNGLIYEELRPEIGNLHMIRTTTLTGQDFFEREDTCTNPLVNLLYAGRLDLSKGLLEMLDVLHRVRMHGKDVNLHFVGWEERNSTTVTDKLKSYASKIGVSDFVRFHGRKRVGAELNEFYRMADVFLIGSKVNEGFPRTIWEAFANSVPVVASAVGSIPLFLKDQVHALLTQPGSVDEMAAAVMRIISEPSLRKSLIHQAYLAAQEVTLDKQCEKMVRLLSEAV